MTGSGEVEGLVLCRVGDDRVAVRSGDVTSIDDARPTLPYAGLCFGRRGAAPEGSRALMHDDGAVVVDAVEVSAERLALLSVPEVVRSVWGGAVTGFVQVAGALWPVVSLRRFCVALGRL